MNAGTRHDLISEGLPEPYTIGLAFTQQELEDIPMEEHDHMLDDVLFPSWW
jgi:5-formyltetrahydrofolate cyclo-ligase